MVESRQVSPTSGSLPRRRALGLLLSGGATALLAACGANGNATTSVSVTLESSATAHAAVVTSPATAATAAGSTAATTSAAKVAATTGAAATGAASAVPTAIPAVVAKDVRIIDTGAKLPTDKVTLHWLQSGPGPKGVFQGQFFLAYQNAHPNITIDFQELPWANISQVLPLGVQNGDAPDIFQLPPAISGAQAVAQGWVTALDDFIPNIVEWKKAFPTGAFIEGITMFGGKTYSFPLSSNKRYDTLTLYNLDAMQQAGYDPASKPFTWDEFRQAAKKLTTQGNGKYYGLMLEGKDTARFAAWVRNLAQMAGAVGGDMNWKTGEYNYAGDQFLAAINLLLAIKSDGSIYPGALALNAAQARAQMPQGSAAMILQGPWNIPQWEQNSPTFKFGVAGQPVPNSGPALPLTFAPGGSNLYWLYNKSKLGAVAGDLFYQLGTLPSQIQLAMVGGVSDPAIFPQALQQAHLDALQTKAATLFDQQLRLQPSPEVRNPDVAKAEQEMHHLTPDIGETIQGIYTGQIANPKQALQDLVDRSNKELDRAIKAAQAKGAKVTRNDWVFPNWDPTRDFAPEDYSALK
ncbi:MAG: ABC transporter substrate-binding protein [Chloroflexota bacterium]